MQIKITARGTEITTPLKDYVHEKVGKLEQFFNNIQKVEVVLEAHSIDDAERRQVAEIRAWAAGLKFIQATEAGRDMYAAIDLVVEEAKRQMAKHKKKLVQEQRRKADKIKQQAFESSTEEDSEGPVLIRMDRFARKPMSLAEAQEELKISRQDFMVFKEQKTKEISVVRKANGGLELLRPEADLTPEEAVDNLQKNNQNLLFFNNKATRVPSVIFRRKSGNFGLIEPEI